MKEFLLMFMVSQCYEEWVGNQEKELVEMKSKNFILYKFNIIYLLNHILRNRKKSLFFLILFIIIVIELYQQLYQNYDQKVWVLEQTK